jgi:hypothetical protein
MDNPPVPTNYGMVDARGLTEHQRAFLLEIAAGKTRKEAAKEVGLTIRTVQKWQQGAAFRQALAEVFEGSIEETKTRLRGASASALDGLIEMQEAMKDAHISIQCPGCGEELEIEAKIPNWTARGRAYELILRAAKVLKDVKEIEGTITTMSIEQKIALALFKSGRYEQIPSFMWEQLQRLGLIPAEQEQPITAQFIVRTEEEE